MLASEAPAGDVQLYGSAARSQGLAAYINQPLRRVGGTAELTAV